MSQLPPLICPYCKKQKLYRINLQKHVLLCENRAIVNKKFTSSEIRDNIENTTVAELLLIITRQDQEIQKMAKQLSQINQLLNRQERRNICDHLNKTIAPDTYIPFSEWISDLEITFAFILSMCQFDIRDTLLERFKQYYYEKTTDHPIPIKAFIENKSKIYLYDTDTENTCMTPQSNTHTTPPSNKWMVFQNEMFTKMVNDIYKKWKRTFAKWMMENAEVFDTNHDMNEMKHAYMNKMDRYNRLSDREKTAKIRQWIVQKVETNMPHVIVIDK